MEFDTDFLDQLSFPTHIKKRKIETINNQDADLDYAIQYLKEKENVKTITPEQKKKTIESALENYVYYTMGNKTNNSNHDCSLKQCDHRPIYIKQYDNEHVCVIGTEMTLCSNGTECPLQNENLHIKCLWSELSITECSITGRIHWCNEECKYKVTDPDTAMTICKLSGYAKEDATAVCAGRDKYNRPVVYSNPISRKEFMSGRKIFGDLAVPCIIKELFNSDAWLQQLIDCKNVSEINAHIISATKSNAKKEEKYIMIACGKIWYLFCHDKCQREKERYQRNVKHINDIMMEKIRHHIVQRNNNRCSFLVWTELYADYTALHAKHIFQPLMLFDESSPNKQQMVKLLNDYANSVVRLWIISKTNDIANLLDSFPDFVLPAMYVMKDGIFYSTINSNLMIVEPDDLLKLSLPEEQTLNEILGLKNNFMETCLKIKKIFMDAIDRHADLDSLMIQNMIIEDNLSILTNISKNNISMAIGTAKKKKKMQRRERDF